MPDVVFTNVAFKDGNSQAYLDYGTAYATAFAKIWGVDPSYHDLPLWVAYLTPVVEQAGLTAEYVPSPALLPEARFYLLSCFTSNYIYAIRKAQSIRDRFPDTKIVLGGPHATCDSIRVHDSGLFDYVVTGPGEAALLGILEGTIPPGVVSGTQKVGGPLLPAVYDALPDYSLIDGDRAAFRQVSVVTTMGCANACVYCAEGRSRVVLKSVPRVIEEVDGVLTEFPEVAFIRFNDSSFSQRVDLYWLVSALGRMQVLSSCQLRADEMSDTVLHYLVTAGVRLVNIGCESGSDEILDRIDKRVTVAQIEDACCRAKNFGLVVNTYWMMGLPGETACTAQQTIKTIERFFGQGLTDLAEVCICVPYPGTLLHMHPDRYDVEIQGELLYQNYMENDLSCMRTRDLDQRDIFSFWQIALNVIKERL